MQTKTILFQNIHELKKVLFFEAEKIYDQEIFISEKYHKLKKRVKK